MAARSFGITVLNWTGTHWTRNGMSLDHGAWSNNGGLVPAEHIPPVFINDDGDAAPGFVFFESESDGFSTGTEGNCDYNADNGAGNFSMFWDNPFIGGNRFSAQAPGNFHLFWGDPSGNNANLTIEIRKA